MDTKTFTDQYKRIDLETARRRTIVREIEAQRARLVGGPTEMQGYDDPEFLVLLIQYYIEKLEIALDLTDLSEYFNRSWSDE